MIATAKILCAMLSVDASLKAAMFAQPVHTSSLCLQSNMEMSLKHRSGWGASPWIQYEAPLRADRMYSARVLAQANHNLPARCSAETVIGVTGSRLGMEVVPALEEVR